MSYPFTLYQRPDGRKSEHEMGNITPEDEAWYRENNIIVGMEEITPEVVTIYAQYGETDGEPDEITYIVPAGERCVLSMAKIRARIEAIRKA
jgi:hypothetical protein